MKTLFDSSVIIAFCVEQHPKHEVAKQWFLKAKNKEIELYVAGHSLMESYSVLTRTPFKPRINATQAKLLLEQNVLSFAQLIVLKAADYKRLLSQLVENNFIGGISYDAVVFESAALSGIQQVITANAKDFLRLKAAFSYRINVIAI
ncbi:MAG: PIN domain-containing protein [Bacteroidota bacterium]